MCQTAASTAAHGSSASTTRIVLIFSLALVVGVGGTTPAEELKPALADRYGDPLPPGALMRLGLFDSAMAPRSTRPPIRRTARPWPRRAKAGPSVCGTPPRASRSPSFHEKNGRPRSIRWRSRPTARPWPRPAPSVRSAAGQGLLTGWFCWDVAKGEARLWIPANHDATSNRWGSRGLAYSPDGKWLAGAPMMAWVFGTRRRERNPLP